MNQQMLERLEQYKEEREKILCLKGADLTLAQIQDSLKRLQFLETQIYNLEHGNIYSKGWQPNRVSSVNREENQPCEIQEKTDKIQERTDEVQERTDGVREKFADNDVKSKVLSEGNLGKNVMTVLAAGLCLLSLGIFITSFWSYMSAVTKLLLITMIGVTLETFGFKMLKKKHIQPFFLGLAGLGASTIFITLIAGSMLWNLYGTFVTGMTLLIWFGVNYWLSRKYKSGIFYVITYLGGIIACWLATMTVSPSLGGEITISLLVVVMFAIEEFGSCKTSSSKYLIPMNMLFSWTIAGMILSRCSSWKYIWIGNEWGSSSGYVAQVLPYVSILLIGLCLFDTKRVKLGTEKLCTAIKVILIFINSWFMGYSMLEAFGSEVCLIFAVMSILALNYEFKPWYFLGAVIPSTAMLVTFSDEVSGCPILIPSIVALAALSIPNLTKSKMTQAGYILMYGITLIIAMDSPCKEDARVFCILGVLALSLAYVGYVILTKKRQAYFNKDIDVLALYTVPSLLVIALPKISWIPAILPLMIMFVALQLYGVIYLKDFGDICLGSITVVKVIWCLMRIWCYLSLITFKLFDGILSIFFRTARGPMWAENIMLTVMLLLCCFINVYRGVRSHNRVQNIISCILLNLHMQFLADLWGWSDMRILISLIGLLMALALIVLGFYILDKTIRLSGLVCSILYVFKIAIFDIKADYTVKTAGSILLAGLVCFVISLLYNKLDKTYGNPPEK